MGLAPGGAAASTHSQTARKLNAELRQAARHPRHRVRPTFATGGGGLRSAASGWLTGNNVWDYGTECWNLQTGPEIKTMLSSFTSYFAGDSPRVGDVYSGDALFGVTGLPCGGLLDVATDVGPPSGTGLAVDAQHRVRCLVSSPAHPTQTDVTDTTWTVPINGQNVSGYWCRSQQVSTGAYGPNLGQVMLGQGWQYEIIYPLKSTRAMSGGSNDTLRNYLRSSNLYQRNQFGQYTAGPSQPSVPVLVSGRNPELSYPSPSSSAVGDHAAHTAGQVLTYWKPGETWFEIGKTTAYGAESQHYTLGSDLGFNVSQDWANLDGGTLYHFRLAFRDSATGIVYRGADQTFTTTGSQGSSGGPPTSSGGGGTTTTPPATSGGGTGTGTGTGDTGGGGGGGNPDPGPATPGPQPPTTTVVPPVTPKAPAVPAKSKAGKCSKLKGSKRAACVKKACGKLKKQKKAYKACVVNATRRK
jgi:hypothetical protein